ncbi:MAG: AraC family transcriptional regulator [Bradyrhizobium sp.]|uniref:AraC family transcriptional regulator n=1 Tax=Bradyrhizobium sp. TaxID=376 RepID=UPI001DBAFCA5|nr:helix-turn-helix domain-containing protein [Bradyrhizobium sp.]MBV9566048.1 AraC family transcriptional regulator [Bradyrhizobium sp.]
MNTHWQYARVLGEDDIEIAARAAPEDLRQVGHFHDEVQIAAVFEGWRSFTTAIGVFRAEAGQIVVLPARLVHAPMMRSCSIVTNIYIAPDHPAVSGVARPSTMDGRGAARLNEILDRVASQMSRVAAVEGYEAAPRWIDQIAAAEQPIAAVAEAEGLSIDGFIRSFTRQVGVTPAQYRIAHRLNVARAMLKQGVSAAEAAQESGFSDQSHLGRFFLRAYGTTPSAYRRCMLTARTSISF